MQMIRIMYIDLTVVPRNHMYKYGIWKIWYGKSQDFSKQNLILVNFSKWLLKNQKNLEKEGDRPWRDKVGRGVGGQVRSTLRNWDM